MTSDDQILTQIREKVDHPATVKELLQRLKWPREQRASFKRALTRLVETGDLIEIRGSRYGLPDRMNLVVGRVTTNPRGLGFVDAERPPESGPTSLFIAGATLNEAMARYRDVVPVVLSRHGDNYQGR